MLDAARFRLTKLEDGEQVIRLRGGKKPGFKSNSAHAGIWGNGLAYVLVPCSSSRGVNLKLARLPDLGSLQNRSSDIEVLLLGSFAEITRLITSGPRWCRALERSHGVDTTHLESFKFRKRENGPSS